MDDALPDDLVRREADQGAAVHLNLTRLDSG
jgi:hypothetical protein